jgi:hypothetical protein
MQYTELGETLDCREKRNCITITGKFFLEKNCMQHFFEFLV